MTRHKNSSRAQIIVDAVGRKRGRKLGTKQARILKVLLEMGTYPGGWTWRTRHEVFRTLNDLRDRGWVTTEEVDETDWRGNRLGGTTTYYRPVPWMRSVMDARTNEEAIEILEKSCPQ